MKTALDASQYYEGKTVGRRFAPPEITRAFDELKAMIEEAGLKGKLVPLIVPDESMGARGTNRAGQPFVTLWGRAPISDEHAISDLIIKANQDLGSLFRASDSARVGLDDDIIVAPFSLHSEARVPPRTWT